MQLTSDQAAQLLGITGGALRQIELNKKPASGFLASRAARLFRISRKQLLKAEDTAQEQPKEKPKAEPKIEPVGPPRRRDGRDDRRGPRRVHDEAFGETAITR